MSTLKGASLLNSDQMWTFKLILNNGRGTFTYNIALRSAIFYFLIHGDLFLSLFPYLSVSILYKTSNDHLHHLPRNLRNFSIFLLVCDNLKNLIIYF